MGASNQNHSRQIVVIQAPKSVAVAFLLTFFFGPLGMLYSTVKGALIMLFVVPIIAVILGVVLFDSLFLGGGINAAVLLGGGSMFLVGLLIYWPCCIIWGCVAVSSYNNRLTETIFNVH
jgi:hypothetical protein